ncbi:response regulator [Methanolacinia petrolearia]|uniref:response regulator n=1 Tax=Methanolacinia petrolearia TaxID=54120 RepID=UPI003BAC0208
MPAKGGVEGIELAIEKKPDLIILDLLMPEFDGFEVLKELKRKSVDIPVLIASADIQDTSHDLCMELGAADFINKPINHDKLTTAINRILGSRD